MRQTRNRNRIPIGSTSLIIAIVFLGCPITFEDGRTETSEVQCFLIVKAVIQKCQFHHKSISGTQTSVTNQRRNKLYTERTPEGRVLIANYV